MKKRLYIISLVFTFFISTTGLPVTMHLCKMMGNSFEKCDMCSMPQEPVEPSCCMEETDDNLFTISNYVPTCCQTELVSNKIDDQFIFVKTGINNKLSLMQSVSISCANAFPSEFKALSEYSFYHPPPSKVSNNVYIALSVLLI